MLEVQLLQWARQREHEPEEIILDKKEEKAVGLTDEEDAAAVAGANVAIIYTATLKVAAVAAEALRAMELLADNAELVADVVKVISTPFRFTNSRISLNTLTSREK
jgi:hypothetical protein